MFKSLSFKIMTKLAPPHELDQRSVVGRHHIPTRELYHSPPQIAQRRGKKMENSS